MSVLLTKFLWYPIIDRKTEALGDNKYDDENPINLTDVVVMGAGKGIDIKNNILTLTLKNAHQLYINTSNEIKFEEQDQIKVYVKYTDDGTDVEATKWANTTVTTPETEHLVGVFYVIEFSTNHSGKDTIINLRCADKTYILFNKVLAKDFGKVRDGLTTPEVIQKIIRLSSQSGDYETGFRGTGSDAGVFYEVDARLENEGGFITSSRRGTREDGNTNADVDFPKIDIAKVWKPIYEWISELSQIEHTNNATELNGDTALTYGRPFIFWVDETNHFHWIYPNDTIADYIEVGTAEGVALSYNSALTNDVTIHSQSLTKKVFDVTNMIIFNAGDDMYNTGIWNYELDTTSRVKSLKMRVVPMIDIAEKYKNLDYTLPHTVAANREAGDGGVAGYPLYQFPLDARYPLSSTSGDQCAFLTANGTFTASSDITSDTTYNNALREFCEEKARLRARALLAGLSHARWKGSITIKGKLLSVGNLVEYTDVSIGIYKQKLRIMDIKHNISTKGWFSTVSLEEDPGAVEVNP